MADADRPMAVRSDIRVDLLRHCGDDLAIAEAAWMDEPESGRGQNDPAAVNRVIRKMMRGKHGTPFEMGHLQWYVEGPSFMFWQWKKHRVGWGYNGVSARYRVMRGEFYVPPAERPLVEPDGFKPMSPVLAAGDMDDRAFAATELGAAYAAAWQSYSRMVGRGVAREVARAALGFGVYTAFRVHCNPRSLMHFLGLRTADAGAAVKSHPQWEIEQAAKQMEAEFARLWPMTHAAFQDNGRVAP